MKIIILGPTGSGKGTQAKFVSKLLKLRHIESGEIIRKEAKEDYKIKKLLDEGKLLPDKWTIKLINKKLNGNFILDGFPRTLVQAKSLKFIPNVVLFLNVNKKNLIKRLLLRKRFDDTKENIDKRYKIYLKKTLPVINYYKKLKLLKEINGNPSIKQVNKIIKKIVALNQD